MSQITDLQRGVRERIDAIQFQRSLFHRVCGRCWGRIYGILTKGEPVRWECENGHPFFVDVVDGLQRGESP